MARETPALRRSERVRNAWEILLLDNDTREILLLDNDEPSTDAEAMMDPDSEKWQSAMRSEIDFMDENHVWNLVDLPDVSCLARVTPGVKNTPFLCSARGTKDAGDLFTRRKIIGDQHKGNMRTST